MHKIIKRHNSFTTQVAYRCGQVALPVNADGTEVEDACSAHHHIQRDKDVAVHSTEEPCATHHLFNTHTRTHTYADTQQTDVHTYIRAYTCTHTHTDQEIMYQAWSKYVSL